MDSQLNVTVLGISGDPLWGPESVDICTTVQELKSRVATAVASRVALIRLVLDDEILSDGDTLACFCVCSDVELTLVFDATLGEALMKYEAILEELSTQNPNLVKDAAALDYETALDLLEDLKVPADIEAWLVSMLITSKGIASNGYAMMQNGFEFAPQAAMTGCTDWNVGIYGRAVSWPQWCWDYHLQDAIIYISMTEVGLEITSAYFVDVEGRLGGIRGSVWYYQVLDCDRDSDYSLDFIQSVLADPHSANARWAMRPGFPPRMVATSIEEFFSRWLANGLPEAAVGK